MKFILLHIDYCHDECETFTWMCDPPGGTWIRCHAYVTQDFSFGCKQKILKRHHSGFVLGEIFKLLEFACQKHDISILLRA